MRFAYSEYECVEHVLTICTYVCMYMHCTYIYMQYAYKRYAYSEYECVEHVLTVCILCICTIHTYICSMHVCTMYIVNMNA